jgi:hypothetical protein
MEYRALNSKAYDIKAKELFGEFAWLNFTDNQTLDQSLL